MMGQLEHVSPDRMMRRRETWRIEERRLVEVDGRRTLRWCEVIGRSKESAARKLMREMLEADPDLVLRLVCVDGVTP